MKYLGYILITKGLKVDPKKVELLVLIDRRFSRELPIQPDYVGHTVDTILTQKVKVYWKEKDGKDEAVLIDKV